jgi:hypothetical protein
MWEAAGSLASYFTDSERDWLPDSMHLTPDLIDRWPHEAVKISCQAPELHLDPYHPRSTSIQPRSKLSIIWRSCMVRGMTRKWGMCASPEPSKGGPLGQTRQFSSLSSAVGRESGTRWTGKRSRHGAKQCCRCESSSRDISCRYFATASFLCKGGRSHEKKTEGGRMRALVSLINSIQVRHRGGGPGASCWRRGRMDGLVRTRSG